VGSTPFSFKGGKRKKKTLCGSQKQRLANKDDFAPISPYQKKDKLFCFCGKKRLGDWPDLEEGGGKKNKRGKREPLSERGEDYRSWLEGLFYKQRYVLRGKKGLRLPEGKRANIFL